MGRRRWVFLESFKVVFSMVTRFFVKRREYMIEF